MAEILGGKWTKKSFTLFNSNPTKIPYFFVSYSLAISASLRHHDEDWVQAGILYQFINHPVLREADLNYQLKISLNKLVIFDFLPVRGYKLRFEPSHSIDSLNPLVLTIYEPSMPLYQIASTNSINPAASTSFVPTTPVVDATAAKKIVSASSDRKELTIYNPDPKNSVYIDLNNTVTASNASFIIPPGQVYVADIHWTGEVWGITKAGSITLTVREFFS